MKNKGFRNADLKPLLLFVFLLAFLALRTFLPSSIPPDLSEPVTVIRVIDGDTIEISGGITVRLIGVDTPESVHPDETKNSDYGKAAAQWTTDLLSGQSVRLEYDTEQTDSYGRTLAYVYLDGVMVNEILLKNGLAKTMSISPNTKYANRFQMLEQEAKQNRVGFWKDYFMIY